MGINQHIKGLNRTKMWRKGKFSLCLSWEIHFPQPSVLLVLELSDFNWITPLVFLFLHIVEGGSWDLVAPIIMWGKSYTGYNTYSHMFINPLDFIYMDSPDWFNTCSLLGTVLEDTVVNNTKFSSSWPNIPQCLAYTRYSLWQMNGYAFSTCLLCPYS